MFMIFLGAADKNVGSARFWNRDSEQGQICLLGHLLRRVRGALEEIYEMLFRLMIYPENFRCALFSKRSH
jgi:hypothetical protein